MKKGPGRLQLVSLTLLAVAVAAGAFLWSTRVAPRAGSAVLGGPLLPRSAAPVDGLLVNVGGVSHRLDRLPAGAWVLSGALADDLDQRAMGALVDSLLAAQGGPLLPGTEPGDRRYDFNGPEGVHLTVHRADGSSVDLALGVVNPVTGTRYASGAGRRFCFTVPMPLRDKLASLPHSVRSRLLLPGVDFAGIDRIIIEADGAGQVLARRDGAWWLSAPDGPSPYGPLAVAYQGQYDDRRRQDADGLWLLASSRRVRRLVYEVSGTTVRELASPEESSDLAVRWQLDPPWRRVTLAGPAVRPLLAGAPGDDGADPVIAFGPPLDPNLAPALRRGQVLVVEREAVQTLLESSSVLLELGAMPVAALEADELEIVWEGRPLLRGTRTGERDDSDGRRAWLTTLPEAAQWTGTESARHGLVRDLVVNIERQAITEVLPPTGVDPLRAEGRAELILKFDTGPGARALRWAVGWLREPSAFAQAAVWSPATGQLLGIGDDLPVTMRNAAELAAPRR